MTRSARVRALLAAATLSAAASLSANDWPGWRGVNRDGQSAETGLLGEWPAAGPPLAWKASGLGGGLSSVAVVGDRIYTLGDKDGAQQVLALSRKDGSLVWSAKVGAAWKDEYGGPRGTPTVDGDLLYALGSDGDLVCLETATGKERWRKNL